MDIYPAILAHSEVEFRRKVEHVRALGLTLHVDVMDGSYVQEQTWAEPSDMEEIMDELPFAAHLMVSNPEHAVPVWSVSGATTVYFHAESTHREELIIRAIGKTARLGLAVNPETSLSMLGNLLPKVSALLIMGVPPGRSGQDLHEDALVKIKEAKRHAPHLYVIVDGGVKAHNIAKIAEAGADGVVIGSALTDQPDPLAALAELHQALG